MKTILALIAACLPLTAQTLTISTTGDIRLDPPPERPAKLYAADSPHAEHWEFVMELAQTARIDTNRSRFYRAYVPSPPLKLLKISETNQTLRGSCDKEFTNILLIVNGVTNKGWSYDGSSRLGTNGNFMPVVTRSDFSFHRLAGITSTTPALLIIRDDDGYVFQTNVWLAPGPYVPLLPRHLRPRAGLSPAGAVDLQTTSGWGLLSHAAAQTLEVPDTEYEKCRTNVSAFNGSWDGDECFLNVTHNRCVFGKLEECDASYVGYGGGPMMLSAENGPCNYVSGRNYSASAEIGSYNSDTDDIDITSRYRHTADTRAELWLGGQLRGSAESNYWVVLTIVAQRPVGRILSNMTWGEPSTTFVNAIGGEPTRNRKLYLRVPPDGLVVKVTPGFGKFAKGWFRYWIEYVVLPATE